MDNQSSPRESWEQARALLSDLVGVPEPADVLALAKYLTGPDGVPEVPSEPGEVSLVLTDQEGYEFETVRDHDRFLFLRDGQPTYLPHEQARELNMTSKDLLYKRR